MRYLTLSTAIVLCASTARADDNLGELQGILDQRVVTTASRTSEAEMQTPAFTRTISAEDIRRYGIRSLDEALDFLGVGIRTAHTSGPAEVGARGVLRTRDDGNHVLLLVDGQMMLMPSFGQALGVPLELIDHVEVVLGPGSVMYGSNAVLAVVNVVTKSASAHAGTHFATELSTHSGDAVTPIGSSRTTLTGGYTHQLFGKLTEITAGASFFIQENLKSTLGPQDAGIDPVDGLPLRLSKTGPRTGIWGGRPSWLLEQNVPAAQFRIVRDQLELMLIASEHRYNHPQTTSGNFDQPLAFRARRVSISGRQGIALGRYGDASVRLFADSFVQRSDFHTSATVACPRALCDYRNDDTWQRLGAEVQANLDWLKNKTLVTQITGFALTNRAEGTFGAYDGSNKVILPVEFTSTDHSRYLLAASAQQTWNAFSWLAFNAGARVDRDERFPAVVSPRIAVIVQPWRDATLKGFYSEAFRAPTIFETDHRVPFQIPGPLRPEETASTEVVFEQRLQRHRVAIGVFDAHYDRLIDTVLLTQAEIEAAVAAGLTSLPNSPTTVLTQFRNATEIHSQGFTFAGDAVGLDGRLRFGASFTGSVARDRANRWITVAPRVFGNARVSYQLAGNWPTLALASTFAGKALVDTAYEGGYSPLPFLGPSLDLRATATGNVSYVKGLSYRVIANHAFQQFTQYAIGPGTRPVDPPQPELTPVKRFEVTLGLQYDF
jgi:outer membrane cobalamin receptor